MKIIAIYVITLLLSSNVFAFQDDKKVVGNDQNQIAFVDHSATNTQATTRLIAPLQVASSADTIEQTPIRQQDELLTEISTYALIVMIYSLYWMRAT